MLPVNTVTAPHSFFTQLFSPKLQEVLSYHVWDEVQESAFLNKNLANLDIASLKSVLGERLFCIN